MKIRDVENINMTKIDWKVLKQIQIVLFFSKQNVDLGFEAAGKLKDSLDELFENDPFVPPIPKGVALPLEIPRIIFHDNNKKVIFSKQKVEIGVEIQSQADVELLEIINEKICDYFKEQTFSRIGIIFEHEDNKPEFFEAMKKKFFVAKNKVSNAKEFSLMWANRFAYNEYNMNLAHTVFCSTLPELSGNTIGKYVLDYNTVPEEDYNLDIDEISKIWVYCFAQYGDDKDVFVKQE